MEDTFEIRDKPHGQNRVEYSLYVAMKGLGLNPKPQYKIDEMTVDFAFPDEKLVVEVYGPYHEREEQKVIDMRRGYKLRELEWKRKTFRAEKVRAYTTFCAEKVKEELDKINGVDTYTPKKENSSTYYQTTRNTYPPPKKVESVRDEEAVKKREAIERRIDRDIEEAYRKRKALKREKEREEALRKKIAGAKAKAEARAKNNKIICVVCIIVIILLLLFIFQNNPTAKITKNPAPKITENTTIPQPSETIIVESPKIIVTSSNTDVIIANNQQKNISVNVTYRIFSNWFGIDSQQSKIFNVSANTQKNFTVYANAGCSNAPCSVRIISYKEIQTSK
jgi:very-short-patch-repair endonuclease/uncharacterized protein YcfL